MRRSVIASAITAAVLLAVPSAASAAPRAPVATASCAVDGNVVNGVALPTDEVINFMVTDSSGTSGWVLGFTSDGTWSVSVPVADGPTTYQFVSRTWGPRGAKYTVFASCS